MKTLEEKREDYLKFYKNFGMQLKFGVYNDFGMHKDDLKDLLLFYSSEKKDYVTFKEYIANMKDKQDKIYYACGESVDKINLLPQVESVKEKGYEILYLTDYIDEFAIQVLKEYDGKEFVNVSNADVNLDSDADKKKIDKINDDNKDILSIMSESLKDNVKNVKFTNKLKSHPVCLSTRGNISLEMEKVINAMPTDENIKAESILEINADHPIAKKLETLYKEDQEELKKYAKILYNEARLIEGLPVDNPTELTNMICDILSK